MNGFHNGNTGLPWFTRATYDEIRRVCPSMPLSYEGWLQNALQQVESAMNNSAGSFVILVPFSQNNVAEYGGLEKAYTLADKVAASGNWLTEQ